MAHAPILIDNEGICSQTDCEYYKMDNIPDIINCIFCKHASKIDNYKISQETINGWNNETGKK